MMMKTYKYILFFIVFLFLLQCKSIRKKQETSKEASNSEWLTLFNGKNLEGWTVKINGEVLGDNYKNTFRAENGILRVNYDSYEKFDNKFGHLFYKTPFKNYRLRLKYRFVGNQINGGQAWATKNSGVMIHGQSPESMLLNQEFPISLEVQLLGGIDQSIPRSTGNLCTPGTHVFMEDKLITDHCNAANSKTYYGEEWVHLEIIVDNGNITHKINGETVIRYANPILVVNF